MTDTIGVLRLVLSGFICNVCQGEIGRLQADQLAGMRDNLNTLFHECVAHLAHTHQIRVVYALQTLVGVIKAVYKKCVQLSGFDLVNFLIGFDRAEQEMSILLSHVNRFLAGEEPACLKVKWMVLCGFRIIFVSP